MLRAEALTADDVLSPDRFAAEGYPFEAWKVLRRDAPLRWFDLGQRRGFWAVTRAAKAREMKRAPQSTRLPR